MPRKLGHLSGTSYKSKSAIDGLAHDVKNRNLFIGQREASIEAQACILIGKVNERGTATDYFNSNVWLDVEFPHVVFIAGRRGSGKSYDLGVLAEGLCADGDNNFSHLKGKFTTVIFDLQSQFWTLGEELNKDLTDDEKQLALVGKWGLEGQVQAPQLLLPAGCATVTGNELPFRIPPASLELVDWLNLADIQRFEPMGQLLRNCLHLLRSQKPDFTVQDVVATLALDPTPVELSQFQLATFDALRWRLDAVSDLAVFAPAADLTQLLLESARSSIILLRELDDTVKAVVVAVTMRHIERAMARHHQQRKVAIRQGKEASISPMPSRVWTIIDEAHLICPANRSTSANKVIVDYVKRGRDAGLSLALATQQPSALDAAAISQVDLTLIHRLTIEADISAALHRLPTRLPDNLTKSGTEISEPRTLIRQLSPGECIVADAEASRAFVMSCRPRLCPHGGGEPQL